jgi:predicted nucleotidyltransferase
MEETVLFVTNVGSHMWKMERPDSDIDLFKAYMAPTKDILTGTAKLKSRCLIEGETDYQIHEIGTVVHSLLAGNINYVWGTMSPIIMPAGNAEWAGWFHRLRGLVKAGISKNVYHSINGLANHNYKKYIASAKVGDALLAKKCNMIVRTIKLGINILDNRKFEFGSTANNTPETVLAAIKELEEAYKASKLPEESEIRNNFLEFLYEIRMSEIENKDIVMY